MDSSKQFCANETRLESYMKAVISFFLKKLHKYQWKITSNYRKQIYFAIVKNDYGNYTVTKPVSEDLIKFASESK